MITCCIQYTLDPHQIQAFEEYATTWPPIIRRCGGDLIGYFLPKEGANNFALALINFPSLAEYEVYRRRLAEDPDAKRNFAAAQQARCILAESRSFLRQLPAH
ncbi:MAG TPA: NIPSNAP family protein [Chloroflexota bacterium]|nr:NIPSNAP family protein [Chloroflexota bacterium]